MAEVTCNCGTKLAVPDPRPELINGLTVSMITWAHGEPTLCPNCGFGYLGMIGDIPGEHLKFMYKAIQKEQLPANVKYQAGQERPRIISPFGR